MDFWQWLGSAFGGFTNWWNTLNIGTLAEAGAAAASFLVVLVTLGITRREGRRHRRAEIEARMERLREEFEKRRIRASQVSLVVTRKSPDVVTVEVVNQSDMPIGSTFVMEPDPGETPGTLKAERGLTGVVRNIPGVVPAGKSFTDVVEMKKAGEKITENLSLWFKDAYGGHWWVFANGERGPEFDPESSLGRALESLQQAWERQSPTHVRLRRWIAARRLGKADRTQAEPPVSPEPTPRAPRPWAR